MIDMSALAGFTCNVFERADFFSSTTVALPSDPVDATDIALSRLPVEGLKIEFRPEAIPVGGRISLPLREADGENILFRVSITFLLADNNTDPRRGL
jgi:hypothetical protein